MPHGQQGPFPDQPIRKTLDFSYTLDQMDLKKDIYHTFHPAPTEYTSF